MKDSPMKDSLIRLLLVGSRTDTTLHLESVTCCLPFLPGNHTPGLRLRSNESFTRPTHRNFCHIRTESWMKDSLI